MRIALAGPSELSEFDRKEIEIQIDDMVKQGHEIAILAYRSIEIEVFKYFVKHVDAPLADKHGKPILDEEGQPIIVNYAPKLSIYTFQPIEHLPEKIKTSIEYLVLNGAQYRSFHFNEILIQRSKYIKTWDDILKEADSVVSFYDGEKTTLMIPVDRAVKRGLRGVIYDLPRASEDRFRLEAIEKIRVVQAGT